MQPVLEYKSVKNGGNIAKRRFCNVAFVNCVCIDDTGGVIIAPRDLINDKNSSHVIFYAFYMSRSLAICAAIVSVSLSSVPLPPSPPPNVWAG